MKITDAIRINYKKLKTRTSKALFLIVPLTVLVALSFIISSQVKNIKTAMDVSIFDEIREENTILELIYPREEFRGGGGPQMMTESEYSEVDLQNIESIDHIESVSMNYDLPISNIITSDLFENIEISFSNFSVLKEDMAGNYTSEDFSYNEGEVIPIILNANQLQHSYEDWEGEDELEIDFREMREAGRPEPGQEGERPEMPTPIKTEAIEYEKDDLLGKEFSITFGGFEDIADYTIERDEGVMTFIKLTESEIEEKEEERAISVGEYWDYDELSAGITYKFKVVAIIESEVNNSIYIPEEFASKLMQEYISYQLDAQISDVPIEELNSTYTGLLYDGTELVTSSSLQRRGPFMGMGGGRPGENDNQTESESYEIPGLIIEVTDDDEISGVYEDTEVFDDAIQSGNIITIKIDGLMNRDEVIEKLNKEGYAYQDLTDLDVLTNIQQTLDKISTGLIISFIVLSIAIIVLTMSKFVSDSKKEIGIFRAVGFTKANILTIFLLQSVLYTFVGYISGFVIGILGNFISSSFIARWFENFVDETVRSTLYVVTEIDLSIFRGLDFNSIGILSIILIIITLVISCIPAFKASTVSPVEAIKNQ